MGRLIHLLFNAVLLGAVILGGAGPSTAQDLGVLQPNGSLILPLNTSGLSGEIAIEIDEIDVTEFVSILDGKLVLSPRAPLSGGVHQVTVFLYSGSSYKVVSTYSFLVEQGAVSGASLTIAATHELGARNTNGDTETFANSSGSLEIVSNDSSLNGRIEYLGASESEDQINGNAVDITEYFFEYARTGGFLDFTGRVGHQNLNYDAVLIGDVSRRGVALMFSRPGDQFQFGFFGARSSDAQGAYNILGIKDDTDRMFGAKLAWRPFLRNDFRISLQDYEGEGIPNGANIAGKGSGVSFGLDGTARTGRLRYGVFFGRTEWDEDGDGAVFTQETGDALQSYLNLNVLGGGGSGKNLTLGFAYEKVDHAFYSLANPGVAAGGETFRFTADYTAGQLALNFYADTIKSNVGGLATWPTDRMSLVSLDGRYDYTRQGTLNSASFRFGASVDWQDRLITPLFAPLQEDYKTISLYLGLDRYNDTASWSLDYVYLDDNDQSALNSDSLSHSITASFDYSLNDQLSLNGSGSLTYANATIGNWQRQEASFGMQYDIVPDEWSLALDFGMTGTNEPGIEGGGTVSADLVWSFNPAAELVFSAAYKDGSYTEDSNVGHEAIVGVLLRAHTSIFR